MPPQRKIRNLSQFAEQEVTLRGWIQGKRSGGKIVFLLVRDGTGTCQCIVEAKEEAAFTLAQSLTQESSIEMSGTVRLEPRASGGCELNVASLTLVHLAEEYPITRKAHGTDFLMSHRHLWLRSDRQSTILKLRHTLIQAVRAFFDQQGFTLVDTPILSPGAAEGAGTLFPVDYFGDEIYLAQTGQLYLESACMALGKVYCFGPTFRAEKSKTRRHLTEFWMVEPEIAYATLQELTDHAERLIVHLVQTVLDKHRSDLESLGRDTSKLEAVQLPFPRLTYSEAVERLRSPEVEQALREALEDDRKRLNQLIESCDRLEHEKQEVKKKWKLEKITKDIQSLKEEIRELDQDLQTRPEHIEQAKSFEWGKDLGGAEETILSQQFERPIFILKYPKHVKAFYMKQAEKTPDLVLNLDLLAPEGYGEIIGGSERENDLEKLLHRMNEEKMDTGPYEWYLDLRRYGSIPHGGFGLGIERTVAWICGLKHVRETIPFARLMGRIYP